MAKAKPTTTQKSLHRLFEEAKKLTIRHRVPYFEELLKSGAIDEPEYAFLASWSIDEILSDSKRSEKDFPKLYLEFGSRRLYKLHSRKNWREILGEGRSRFQAEKKGKDEGTKSNTDQEWSRYQAEDNEEESKTVTRQQFEKLEQYGFCILEICKLANIASFETEGVPKATLDIIGNGICDILEDVGAGRLDHGKMVRPVVEEKGGAV